jgi:hypothetical protein
MERVKDLQANEHGSYGEISDEKEVIRTTAYVGFTRSLLPLSDPCVRREKRCVVHFYHTNFKRCEIMDKHLAVSTVPQLLPFSTHEIAETCPKVFQHSLLQSVCREHSLASGEAVDSSIALCCLLCWWRHGGQVRFTNASSSICETDRFSD